MTDTDTHAMFVSVRVCPCLSVPEKSRHPQETLCYNRALGQYVGCQNEKGKSS